MDKTLTQTCLGPYITGSQFLKINDYYLPKTYEQIEYLKKSLECLVNNKTVVQEKKIDVSNLFKLLFYALKEEYSDMTGKIYVFAIHMIKLD